MSVGGIGTSASETDSRVLTVRHDITATDSNIFANKNAGNLKLGKRSQLVINNGLSQDDFFGALRNSTLGNANQAPPAVQAAVTQDTVDRIERNESDRAAVSVQSIKKYLIWAVLFLTGLFALGIVGAVAGSFFKKRKSA